MPEAQFDLNQIESLPSAAQSYSEQNQHEDKKNDLANQLLQQQIERDIQRREHRQFVVGIGIVACIVSYVIFALIAFELYGDLELLKEISNAWVIPFLGLLALPTIFLTILAMCLYRDKPSATPDAIAQALLKILPQIVKP